MDTKTWIERIAAPSLRNGETLPFIKPLVTAAPYVCSRCGEYTRGPLDVGHVCPDQRRAPAAPTVGLIVAIVNPDSAFYGRLAEIVDVADRTVFLRFISSGIRTPDDVAFPFGVSEVVALAPGEVTEMFGR